MSRLAITLFAAAILTLVLQLQTSCDSDITDRSLTEAISFTSDNPRAVYSADPADPWNRIFHALFTRTTKVRLSTAFAEGAPFTKLDSRQPPVSTRIFERFENGDRPFEPLYPSFFSDEGVLKVLTEPAYSEFKSALNAALNEGVKRPPVSRALMQSDLWAAYDMLFVRKAFRNSDEKALLEKRKELLLLLARLTKKLALTPDKIQSLPDNYADASVSLNLPKLFAPDSDWIEVQVTTHRLHDVSADFRRFARVFFKPTDSTAAKQTILESLRNGNSNSLLDSVALVVQDVLINSHADVVPTHVTMDVQVRKFFRDVNGRLIRTELHQYELSRRSLLNNINGGGMVEVDKNADLYLPASGNDYFYASPQFSNTGHDYPLLVNLQQRCEGCHGLNASGIFTLWTQESPSPPIQVLPASANVHGWYVAGRKFEREDFKSLIRLWR